MLLKPSPRPRKSKSVKRRNLASRRRGLLLESLEDRRLLSATGLPAPSILTHSNATWASSATIHTLVPGATVTSWSDSQFTSASVSDFDDFDFIYLGDNASSQAGVVSAKDTWAAAISGRAVITGVHFEHAPGHAGASAVFADMANWIHAGTGTGLLVSSQFSANGSNWIPTIDPFNGITYAANGGGYDNVRIVDPGHATMAGSTSASLSNFYNSAHSYFGNVGSFTVVAEVSRTSGERFGGPAVNGWAPHVLVATVGVADQDGDGIADSSDNCPTVANPSQADLNGNGVGDACEAAPTVTISPNAPAVPAGSSISFTTSASDADDPVSSLSYEWRVDGIVQAGETGDSFTSVFNTDSTVRVTVRDPGNLSGFDEANVTVIHNQAPVADAGGPYTMDEGDSISLDGSGSSDPDGDTLSYDWDLDNDGVFGDVTGVSHTLTWSQLAAFGIDDDGSYPIKLRVDDGNGEQNTAISTITVENAAPSLDNVAITPSIDEGDDAFLTGDISDPGVNDSFTMIVDWGDGSPLQTVNLPAGSASFSVPHTYVDDEPSSTTSDSYDVSIVSFIDDDGDSAGVSQGGSIFMTGHDIMSHNNQAGYSVVVLDYLRGASSVNEIPRADYDIVHLNTTWNGFGDPRNGISFGTYSERAISSFSSASDFANFLNGADVLSIPEHVGSDITILNSFASEIEAFFNAGGDLFVDSSNSEPGYYGFLPSVIGADGPGISTSSGFSPTAAGAAIGVTNSMVNGYPTHNTFQNPDPVFTIFETHGADAKPISMGAQNVVISQGGLGSALSVTVNNVAPTITGVSTTSNSIDEGQSVTVSGTFTDPALGVATETFTGTATWSDGATTPVTISGGTFSTTRTFADDNPSGTASDPFTVDITISDDDLGSDTATSSTITVHNVAPQLQNVAITSPINENDFATLSGDIIDPGTQDTFTLTVDWGDGSDPDNDGHVGETFSYVAGTTSFSETHQYLDDNPSGTATDQLAVTLQLSDDDQAVTTGGHGNIAVFGGTDGTSTLNGAGNVASDLTGLGIFSSVTVLDGTESITALQQYDSILIYSNGFGSFATYGNALADYVDAGGGLVAATFAFQYQPSGTDWGRLETDGYYPFENYHGNYSNSTLGIFDSGHAIMAGPLNVTSIGGFYRDLVDLSADAQLVASWDDGRPLVAVDGGSGTVGITLFPNDYYGNLSGDYIELFGNALTFAAGEASATATATITVNNVAPQVDLDPVLAISEDGTATLSGTITDPGTLDTFTLDLNWGDSLSPDNTETIDLTAPPAHVSWNAATRTFSVTHQYLDDNPSGTSFDSYLINATVTDDDTDTGSDTESVTVNNVAPTIMTFETDSPFCGGADENETVTATLAFTDPGTLDTHEVVIDWGDGQSDTISLTGSSQTITPSHVYTTGGVFEVTVSVADDDTGIDFDSTTVVVTGVGVVGDTLYVVGTDGDDQVSVNQTGNGMIKVHADFLANPDEPRVIDPASYPDGINQIYMILCGGDDHATMARNMTLPTIIDGGMGNDHLNAGGGGTVLLGGDGNDMLVGGSGNDIMIGGVGLDRLVSGGGEDFLAAGSSSYESDSSTHTLADDEALLGFLEDWGGTASRQDRESALDELVNSLTADGDEDKLTGASADDWFLDDAEDLVTDLVSNGKGNGGAN